MDSMHLMTAFVAVCEEQSFAAAALRLGISRASVTRAISGLEDMVGVKLLMRTTRSVRLTEAGSSYLNDVRVILARIAEANESVADADVAPTGHLNVTASVLFGAKFVVPCIAEYLRRFPETTVSALFLDRVVNLRDEGIDVAVRIGPAHEAGMKAIRVGEVRRVLCGSPHYLASRGTPHHPADLHGHTMIAAAGVSPEDDWNFGRNPDDLAIRVSPRLKVASNDAAIEAALGGLGLTRVLSYQVAEHLATGRLRIVLADHEEMPWPVRVLHREDRRGTSKVRKFTEILVRTLQADAELNPAHAPMPRKTLG